MSKTHYSRFLDRTVDAVFDKAVLNGITWLGLAHKSGLAKSTVYNLGNRDTRFPQLRTIFLLAKAVGLRIEYIEQEARKYSQGRAELEEVAHA